MAVQLKLSVSGKALGHIVSEQPVGATFVSPGRKPWEASNEVSPGGTVQPSDIKSNAAIQKTYRQSRPAATAEPPLEAYLACGFTPLHLQTFLAAHLRQLRETISQP